MLAVLIRWRVPWYPKVVSQPAELFAKKNNIEIIVLSPNWTRYGKAAAIIRNTDIVGECDYLIAFPTKESRGTIDSINKAKKLHKNVKIINVN